MKVEKMETLGVNVRDVGKAVAFFSDLFELDFGEFSFGGSGVNNAQQDTSDPSKLGDKAIRVAMDRTGYFEFLETAQTEAEEGMRNIHFKVADIEVAKREMERRGIPLVAETMIGRVCEVVYNPKALFGIRLCFVQYEGSSLIDAVLDR